MVVMYTHTSLHVLRVFVRLRSGDYGRAITSRRRARNLQFAFPVARLVVLVDYRRAQLLGINFRGLMFATTAALVLTLPTDVLSLPQTWNSL